MGRIQLSTGLITGIKIEDTVEALMQLAARPRNLVSKRTQVLKQEQVAVSELAALLYTVQYTATNLDKDDLYDERTVQSSNASVLSATLTGDPPKGNYQFTTVRLAQYHQLLSSGFETDTGLIGGGTLTFRFGAHVERSLDLDAFGGGQGVARGMIRITDRSGASAEIDLSTVQTVDDVLEAINSNATIDVTAATNGDCIRLTDHTGQTVSNLKVQEIGGGTTAASLGLAGIDAAEDSADGQDVVWLTDDLELDLLNDGSGLLVDQVLDDIHYELSDGTSGDIDLSPRSGAEVDEETTLGDVLDVINAAAPGKLKAEIAPDGDRLLLTDLTTGGETFTLQSLNDSSALKDLGLDGDSVDGVITGRRILGGVKTVLLSSMEGGQGLGELGTLALTDRSGASDTVDLSGAETLSDVIDLVNAAAVGIVAQVNQATKGIELVDTTGASAGNLIVANADATNTADKLAIAVDADVTSVDSGDLHLQIIAHNTELSDLNGEAGVARGKLTIYDTTGQHAQLDLANDGIQTVGDVIRTINGLGLQIQAELNETGDGIRIRDLAQGDGSLRVEEGNYTTAADLHLLGEAVEVEIDGQTTQVIDGSTTYVVELDDGTDQITNDTRLDELNNGDGVARGSFTIVDTLGAEATLDLDATGIATVGGLIDAINHFSLAVEAELNETGDGIRIRDLAHGSKTLQVLEGDSTTAEDLHLLGSVEEIDFEGQTTQVIDGAGAYATVQSLGDLCEKINSLNAGVVATVLYDGSGKPYRLSLQSGQSGRAGELVVDTSAVDFTFQETARARDALLAFGESSAAGSGVLISSSSNTFENVISGIQLQVKQVSDTPVTVTVDTTDTTLVATVATMVDNYNRFRERLLELTEYNVESETRSILTGDSTALRLDTDLSYLLSGPFRGTGSIQSLAQLGVSFEDDGTLKFDQSSLKTGFAEDPEAVKSFFADAELGLSAKLGDLIERLSGEESSLLSERLKVLSAKIEDNEERIAFLNERLEAQRDRLYLDFYRMELAVAKLQSNLSVLDIIQPLTALTLSSD